MLTALLSLLLAITGGLAPASTSSGGPMIVTPAGVIGGGPVAPAPGDVTGGPM